MRLNVNPLESVGDVKFGMTREEVRSILGDAEEFKKDPDDDITTDDFGFCHVFYDEDDIGPISYVRSIGIYAPDDEMESILFGRDGYYD